MHRRSLILASTAAVIARATRAAPPPPVVLELFTSQGCSSCPPADALLGELARRPGIIALAWHVDYWNRLGWHDPFASREFTDRQHAYARQLQDEVYTPALVVNGAAIVVGSDRRAVSRAVADAPPLTIPVTLRREKDVVAATVPAAGNAGTVLFATYDPTSSTNVGAGENEGRRLQEYRVVRSVQVQSGIAGPLEFPLPSEGQGAAILLQTADLRICGAADLPPGAAIS